MPDRGTCRSCGAVILWVKTEHSSHFATCPNAKEHRKPKEPKS